MTGDSTASTFMFLQGVLEPLDQSLLFRLRHFSTPFSAPSCLSAFYTNTNPPVTQSLQEQQLLGVLMGLEMPMVHVLAAMQHHGIAFSSKVLLDQLPDMELRLQQLLDQASEYIQRGNVEKVIWAKQRGRDALSRQLYEPVEAGGLGFIPPVDTAKGK